MKIIKNSRQINSDSKIGTKFEFYARNISWDRLNSKLADNLLKYIKIQGTNRGPMRPGHRGKNPFEGMDRTFMKQIVLYTEDPFNTGPDRDLMLIFNMDGYDDSECKASEFLYDPVSFILDHEIQEFDDQIPDDVIKSYISDLRVTSYKSWADDVSNEICKELNKIYGFAQQVYEGYDGEDFFIGFDVDEGSLVLGLHGAIDSAKFEIRDASYDKGRGPFGVYHGLEAADSYNTGLAAYKPIRFYGDGTNFFYNVKQGNVRSQGTNQILGEPIRLD